MSTIPIRFVCISDTCGETPELPPGDVLIHAGNLTDKGTLHELERTISWIDQADFKVKLIVAGDRDKCLDAGTCFDTCQGSLANMDHARHQCPAPLKSAASIVYLRHESQTVKIKKGEGVEVNFKVFGSPFSRRRGVSAFGYEIDKAFSLWSEIPLDTDVVISHMPAQHHRDRSP